MDLRHKARPGTDLIPGALAAEAIAELLSTLKRRQQGGRLVTDIVREAKHWLSQGPAHRERTDDYAQRLKAVIPLGSSFWTCQRAEPRSCLRPAMPQSLGSPTVEFLIVRTQVEQAKKCIEIGQFVHGRSVADD